MTAPKSKYIKSDKFLDNFSIDIKEVSKGNRLILCVINYFSRYGWAEGIKDKKLKQILATFVNGLKI